MVKVNTPVTTLIEYRNLADLKRWPRNYREGDVGAIITSIARFGYNGVLRVWLDGTVIAGNHALLALQSMKASGYVLPRGIQDRGGDWYVPTYDVSHLNDTEAIAFALADNHTQELGSQDDVRLSELLVEVMNESDALLAVTGYDRNDIDALLAVLSDGLVGSDPGAQIDRAAELQERWQVQPGDLWAIGDHRLLCGDSTKAEDVGRLMGGERAALVVTSPPYNQNLETFKPSGMQKESPAFVDRMASSYFDSLPEDQYQQQQIDLLEMLPQFMTADASIFYNHKIRYRDKAILSPLEWLSKLSYPVRQEIIWNRGSSITLNARMFIPADERIYWLRVGRDFVFNDEHKTHSTVWDIGAHNDVSVSAAFATEIPLRCINAASVHGDCVLEPYSGSGTTLVACEKTGRRGRGIEIEPKYVSVTLQRLADMGLEPERIDEPHGE